MSKAKIPRAVLISDIHYNLQTVRLASAALQHAIDKAIQLGVPLIIAGDLHDTKANLRGECVNAMINTLSNLGTKCYILIGNHDRLNEKSPEHALGFLRVASDLIEIVDTPRWLDEEILLMPYCNDPVQIEEIVKNIVDATIIMHQGVKGSNSGDYYVDHSAIDHKILKDCRVVSGHYHTRQDIHFNWNQKEDFTGTFSYIGNPYTLNFGEAEDPEKGFQILYSDRSLQFVPTDLRKHVLLEYEYDELHEIEKHKAILNTDDLIKVRVIGPKSHLTNITKDSIETLLNFKGITLDLVPNDIITTIQTSLNESDAEILRRLVEVFDAPSAVKRQLKSIFEEVLK